MVHTLFDEGLVRLGRLQPHVNGVDEVRQARSRPSRPSAWPRACGIAAADIRTLARELAAAERGCVYGRIGTCTQALRQRGLLADRRAERADRPPGCTRRRDVAQGRGLRAQHHRQARHGRGVSSGRHHSRVSGAPEVFGELPITLLAEEIETPARARCGR
jgi:hypothetical protein